MTQIDIREYYDANGEEKPGKKGISLNPEQVSYTILRTPSKNMLTRYKVDGI